MTPSPEATGLLGLSTRELRRHLDEGAPVDPDVLAGHRYRGISLGLPGWVEAITWKTFAKSFHRDGDRVRGWNERLVQTGLEGPVENRRKGEEPVTFGHFEVVRTPEGGALLDYGRGGNPLLDPTRFVRDPLVSLRGEADASVLLGWTYLLLGGMKLPTPSWFVLEREGPVGHVPPSPRG